MVSPLTILKLASSFTCLHSFPLSGPNMKLFSCMLFEILYSFLRVHEVCLSNVGIQFPREEDNYHYWRGSCSFHLIMPRSPSTTEGTQGKH